MESIQVSLGSRTYPIYLGRGILRDAQLYARHVFGSGVFTVTNEIVAPLYLADLEAALGHVKKGRAVLPDGEAHKTLESLEQVIGTLLESAFGRDSTLVALGGGVI